MPSMGQKSISFKEFLTEVPNIRFIAFDTIFTLNTPMERPACMMIKISLTLNIK